MDALKTHGDGNRGGSELNEPLAQSDCAYGVGKRVAAAFLRLGSSSRGCGVLSIAVVMSESKHLHKVRT
ncbi:hypothetical protein CASFOL_030226 [Castilleja foliolosa]|uniref:Uncharacterized protein n=1 Tax=Castilleja foliolosa TaxID=1961234 RepID=A0ABD3CAF1_9LAMI